MSLRILMTGYDFPPQLGGVATYSYHIANELHQLSNVQVQVLAREQSHSEPVNFSFPVRSVQLNSKATLALPAFTQAIRTEIKTWKPDWVINPLWFPDGLATRLAIGQHPIKQGIAAHGLELINSNPTLSEGLRSLLFSPLRRWVLQKAQHTFPVSHFTNSLIQQISRNPPPSTVIHNGVDTNLFFQRPPKTSIYTSHIKASDFVFLSVCRLKPHKGVDHFLGAFAKLRAQHSHLQYIVVGSGPDEKRLKQICQDLGIESSVHFLGRLQATEIVDLYNRADVFTLLSREEPPHVEGFGLVLLEAGACATPSLAGNSGGIPEAIIEGQTGLLCQPTNLNDIIEKAERMITDSQFLNKMSEAANQHALRNTWGLAAQKMAEVLK